MERTPRFVSHRTPRRPGFGAVARRSGLLAAALLAATGCAQLPAKSAIDPQAVRGRSIEVVVQPTPNFYADNRSRRRFGLFGVFAMAHEGNRLVREHGIPDPSHALADALRRSVTAPDRTVTMTDTRQADVDSATGSRAELTLRVRTTNWEYRPFRGASDQFYVIYSARVDLVDNVAGRPIGTDRCEVTPTLEERLTEDELIAESAKMLRDELARASEQCFIALREGRIAASLGVTPAMALR